MTCLSRGLHRSSSIVTSHGVMTAEALLEVTSPISILAASSDGKTVDYKPLLEASRGGKLPYQEWVDVVTDGGRPVRLPRNTEVLSTKGLVAAEATGGARVFQDCWDHYWTGLVVGTLLGDANLTIDKRASGASYRLCFQHVEKSLTDFKVGVLGLPGKHREVVTGYGSVAHRFVSTALTYECLPVERLYHMAGPRLGKRRDIPYRDGLARLLTKESLALWIADDGSLRMNNGNPATPVLSIATHNHSDNQLRYMREYFMRRWQCVVTSVQDKRVSTDSGQSGKFLNFNTKDTLYLLNQLRHTQVKGAEYKFYFPTEGYVEPASRGVRPVGARVRGSRHMAGDYTRPIRLVVDGGLPLVNGLVVSS